LYIHSLLENLYIPFFFSRKNYILHQNKNDNSLCIFEIFIIPKSSFIYYHFKHAFSFKLKKKIKSHAFVYTFFKKEKKIENQILFKLKIQIQSKISCIKKKNQISCIQTCIFKIHIQSKISCIHKCIKHKRTNLMHSYMYFSKRTKSKIHIQTNFMHFSK